ncbi:MAG: PmoA family protein [Phycisphaeraceae bacterium]|nr:PmoA family protein [Phycisphaeraceae bacterium]
MFNLFRFSLIATLIGVLSLSLVPECFAEDAKPADEAGKRLVKGADGKPVLTYEYAHVLGEDGKVTFDTAKVFFHVVGPDGEQTLTKGPGGQFPHHRGIFIGWNKIKHGGKNHDLWHVKNTTQKHVAFALNEAVQGRSAVVSRIDWIGTEGKAILKETRSATVHHDTGGAYALIDFQSTLAAAHGAVELNGDPEHAGIQFRPSQQVAENKSAKYVYPTDDAKEKKYAGLPWVAQTFEVDGQKWTVQQMSHPSNPDDNARWSAYRDYGRFGEFPVFNIADGEKVTLRYRFRVTGGEAPSREELAEAYKAYAE